MKNLVFVTLSLMRGGAERVICNMCNECLCNEYDVTLISLMAAEPEYGLSEKIRLISVDTHMEQYRQNQAMRFLRRRSRVKKILDRMIKEGKKPDILISFLPEPNMIVCSLAGRYSFPMIISVRNDPAKEYGSRLRFTMMKHLYPKADGVVLQTGQAREYFSFSSKIYENSVVIPNPIADEFVGRERPECIRPEIVSVGRLERQKNPLLLFRAFCTFHKEYPQYRLVYYGDGDLRGELEKEIAGSDLAQAVVLKGNTDRIADKIGDAAMFVLASDYEGMPNALMEAMALGLACIATDCPCGGPAFLIRPSENGLLIKPGDEQGLADAMRYLAGHPEHARQMGIKAQGITDALSKERIYGDWLRLLEEKQRIGRTEK